jgi:hypothetical protein
VTRFECAVRFLTERFEGVSPGYARDVALTTCELSERAGLWRRSLELMGVLGLALRLRSRSRTLDRPEAIWRQGLYIGGLGLLAALATTAFGSVKAGPTGVVLASAVALAASLAYGFLRARVRSLTLATVGTAAYVGFAANGAVAEAFAVTWLVAAGALTLGSPAATRSGRRLAITAGAASLAALPLALLAGPPAVAIATTALFAGVIPLALVVAGRFDPRLAAAATTLVFARLAASGFDELGQALAVLEQDGQRVLLIRWIVMGAGVIVAWYATQHSIRRLERV